MQAISPLWLMPYLYLCPNFIVDLRCGNETRKSTNGDFTHPEPWFNYACPTLFYFGRTNHRGMIFTPFVPFVIGVHPSCIPFIRKTEETIFQAQTALKTSRRELAKLEGRQKTMAMLAQEGAISQRQWQQFQAQIQQIKAEIADTEKLEIEAQNQITTLKAMPRCIPT
jgi:hypothetical protein